MEYRLLNKTKKHLLSYIRHSIFAIRYSHLSRGFTIFELLIVIAISTLLAAVTVPVGMRFYQVQVADETTAEVRSAILMAQREARLGKNDRAFGVKFFSDRYTVFEGNQYASRVISEDRIYTLPSGTSIGSTTSEIVFAKVTGIPSATGTFSVGLFSATHTIVVNERGVITQTN